jgi:hypothetical protein
MRKYGKIDANQKEIVDTLRACGVSVVSIASVGDGTPDLLVGYHGCNFLFEVKDGTQPPSKRELTIAEANFRDSWRGGWDLVESVNDALNILGITRDLNILKEV